MDKIMIKPESFLMLCLYASISNKIDALHPHPHPQKPCKYQFSEDLKNIIPVCHRLSFKYMQTLQGLTCYWTFKILSCAACIESILQN